MPRTFKATNATAQDSTLRRVNFIAGHPTYPPLTKVTVEARFYADSATASCPHPAAISMPRRCRTVLGRANSSLKIF